MSNVDILLHPITSFTIGVANLPVVPRGVRSALRGIYRAEYKACDRLAPKIPESVPARTILEKLSRRDKINAMLLRR